MRHGHAMINNVLFKFVKQANQNNPKTNNKTNRNNPSPELINNSNISQIHTFSQFNRK
jgi:hypothetical protein